jgi:hypothetical protein
MNWARRSEQSVSQQRRRLLPLLPARSSRPFLFACSSVELTLTDSGNIRANAKLPPIINSKLDPKRL